MRTGMWISGAGGSGVLIAKKEDGSWSPPSGLLVHTLGVGFMAGIDIYDCVVVINNRSALEAFSKVRVSLGGELSLVAGPLGVGGIVDSEVQKDRRPMFSYMKSRGLYAGAQLDGTVIVERNDENARFYGTAMPIGDILRGNVTRLPEPARMLMGVINDITRGARADRQTPRMPEMPQSPDISTMSDEEIQKMDEAMAIRLQFDLPPHYEEHNSTSSLYELPSPAESHGPSGSSAVQISPIHGSNEESSLPPLPPRPSNSNIDNEKCKLG
jgi:lipid-binding SYLF domain-containing protein